VDGLGFSKSFGLGSVNFYVARPDDLPTWGWDPEETLNLWELAALAQFQVTEQFGFDVGAQGLWGDDASAVVLEEDGDEFQIDHVWTVFGGLRFDFNPNLAFKGIYYYQGKDGSPELELDSAKAWKLIVDVKQDLLQFTSLWLEYDYLDADFFLTYNNTALTLIDTEAWNTVHGGSPFAGFDTKIWRVGALQQWNEKWSSWVYAAGHTLERGAWAADAKMFQWGLGVEYLYNENVAFALGYVNVNWNGDAEAVGYADDHVIRFRTAVTF
jgi:hypothetical protein